MHHQHDSALFVSGPALEFLQDRIRVLNIQSDLRYNSHGITRMIKLPGFHHLRSLTAAMEHLGVPDTIRLYRADGTVVRSTQSDTSMPCLPLTLERLHLTSCTSLTFELLDVLDSLPPGELHLTQITLHFAMSPTPAIILCGTSHAQLESLCTTVQRWLRGLESLAQKHHRVQIFMRTSTSSFITELEAAAHLSNSEIALAAGGDLLFSVCVARSRDGLRERSSEECKFFLFHGVRYRQLFCRPTFNFTRRIDVFFFHGNSNPTFESDTHVRKDDEQEATMPSRYVTTSSLTSISN